MAIIPEAEKHFDILNEVEARMLMITGGRRLFAFMDSGLQSPFDLDAMRDPEFLAEAERHRVDIYCIDIDTLHYLQAHARILMTSTIIAYHDGIERARC